MFALGSVESDEVGLVQALSLVWEESRLAQWRATTWEKLTLDALLCFRSTYFHVLKTKINIPCVSLLSFSKTVQELL